MLELHHLALHGHAVSYRLEGRGQDVLLVHGIAGSSRTWLETMRRLTARYRVLAPDLPGHGGSAAATGDYSLGAHASFLRDLLGSLEIERATVVGHSLGGGIVMQLVYQHPALCERLVLESSGGLGREVGALLRLLSLPGFEWVLPLLVPSAVCGWGNALADWGYDRGFLAPRLAEGWRAYASLAGAESRQAFVRELRAVVDIGGQIVSAKDRLHLSAAQPTLLVWGERDPVIPVAHGRAAQELMPGSRLEVFPGAGHFPHAECPDRFAEVLSEFIEATAPARPLITAAPGLA